jgi:hypothetical protein
VSEREREVVVTYQYHSEDSSRLSSMACDHQNLVEDMLEFCDVQSGFQVLYVVWGMECRLSKATTTYWYLSRWMASAWVVWTCRAGGLWRCT